MAWKDIETERAWRREYKKRHPTVYNERALHLKRRSNYKLLYGITIEDYERMYFEQGGVCAICGNPPPPTKHLFIDHDHKTGKVRGLLCRGCNAGLAFIENVGFLEQGINYLKERG